MLCGYGKGYLGDVTTPFGPDNKVLPQPDWPEPLKTCTKLAIMPQLYQFIIDCKYYFRHLGDTIIEWVSLTLLCEL